MGERRKKWLQWCDDHAFGEKENGKRYNPLVRGFARVAGFLLHEDDFILEEWEAEKAEALAYVIELTGKNGKPGQITDPAQIQAIAMNALGGVTGRWYHPANPELVYTIEDVVSGVLGYQAQSSKHPHHAGRLENLLPATVRDL